MEQAVVAEVPQTRSHLQALVVEEHQNHLAGKKEHQTQVLLEVGQIQHQTLEAQQQKVLVARVSPDVPLDEAAARAIGAGAAGGKGPAAGRGAGGAAAEAAMGMGMGGWGAGGHAGIHSGVFTSAGAH